MDRFRRIFISCGSDKETGCTGLVGVEEVLTMLEANGLAGTGVGTKEVMAYLQAERD